jgi:aminoglycoside/choline kinase family phosphotransferase
MGIFARLAIRDNKAGYLADIPQVMQYFIGVGERYAELGSFMDWFKDTVVGVAQTKINQGSK